MAVHAHKTGALQHQCVRSHSWASRLVELPAVWPCCTCVMAADGSDEAPPQPSSVFPSPPSAEGSLQQVLERHADLCSHEPSAARSMSRSTALAGVAHSGAYFGSRRPPKHTSLVSHAAVLSCAGGSTSHNHLADVNFLSTAPPVTICPPALRCRHPRLRRCGVGTFGLALRIFSSSVLACVRACERGLVLARCTACSAGVLHC